MYLDSENWLKGSIEYENETFGHLGSVATNNGYSDWATNEIPAARKNHHLKQLSQIWNLQNASGWLITVRSLMLHMKIERYKSDDEIPDRDKSFIRK